MATFSNTPRPAYVYEAATDQWIPVGFGPHTHAVTDVTNAFNTTTVTTKGDIVVAAGSNNITRLAAGSNGQSLVADSTTATGLRWQESQVAAGKNVVINGALDIWQRGTSFSSLGRGYKADRWECAHATSTTNWTTTRQSASLSGFQYCLRMTRSSASTDTSTLAIGYSVETVDSMRLMGKTVTMSFYARAGANFSASGNIFNAYLQTYSGTDSSILSGYTSSVASVAAVLTTTWQRFSITGTTNSAHQQIGALMWATPVGTAGANDYYEITGLQIEEGSVATAFSRAGGTLQGELAACQRYYYRLTSTDDIYSRFAFGSATASTNGQFLFNFPVQMRVKPSALDTSAASTLMLWDGATDNFVTAISGMTRQSVNNASVDFTTAATMTQYRPYWAISRNTTSAYVGFSAEL